MFSRSAHVMFICIKHSVFVHTVHAESDGFELGVWVGTVVGLPIDTSNICFSFRILFDGSKEGLVMGLSFGLDQHGTEVGPKVGFHIAGTGDGVEEGSDVVGNLGASIGASFGADTDSGYPYGA